MSLFEWRKVPPPSQLTDAHYAATRDDSPAVTSHFARTLRCRSADLSTPRYVAGQHKGVTAEIYYSGWTRKREV